jgi:hypothetical protein
VTLHDRIVVHVHDTGFRGDRLCDLMHVLPGGQAGTDVEKLPDSRLGGKKLHDPPQESPCRPGGLRRPREGLDRGLCRDPVGLEVVRTAQEVVIDPRWVRDARVDLRDVLLI